MEHNDNWKQVKETSDWFISCMMGKMAFNTHKGDWLETGLSDLRARLTQEMGELSDAIAGDEKKANIISECSDIANIAMMIADKVRRA